MKSSLMAPKLKTTAAERKRKSREKKRNELGEEEYLRQRAEKDGKVTK